MITLCFDTAKFVRLLRSPKNSFSMSASRTDYFARYFREALHSKKFLGEKCGIGLF